MILFVAMVHDVHYYISALENHINLSLFFSATV